MGNNFNNDTFDIIQRFKFKTNFKNSARKFINIIFIIFLLKKRVSLITDSSYELKHQITVIFKKYFPT